ncbi:MAG: flippase [Candidatus Pacebacteria bacterium]|nr:flippase [Candidatus Paceibacterota bacterium]MDR3583251.1 flippase [Candidatus Paceibacterota bacterium]
MRVARKIAYNVLVSSVSKIASTVLALVSLMFITRYLGVSGFGEYATVLAFFSFFAALLDLGLYSISTREISRPGADEEKIMGNIFTLNIVSSLAIIVIAPILVLFFPYPQEVKNAIIIVAGAYLFSTGYQVLNGVFQKNLAMDRVAIAELLGRILQVALTIAAVKLKLDFTWIIASVLFYMIFTFVLVIAWSRKYIRIRPQFDFIYWKNFLKESYPMGLSAIITFLYFKADTILLSVMKSSADVGVYNGAYKVMENITFFPSMLVGLVFPIMAANIFSDRAQFENVSNKTFKVLLVVAIPLVVGTLFLSQGIVQLIGGAGFSQSAVVLRILIFALACIFFSNLSNAILISGNLQKKLMTVLAVAAVLNIGANLILIPRYSYMAAAYMSFLTELFVLVATFYLVARKLDYFPKLEQIRGILSAGLVMGLFLYFFHSGGIFSAGLASVSVYLLALWVFRAVKTSEITSIISRRGGEYEIEEYVPR